MRAHVERERSSGDMRKERGNVSTVGRPLTLEREMGEEFMWGLHPLNRLDRRPPRE